MKQTLAIVSGLLLGSSVFASGLSQLTLSISTPGPDAYSDGTPVQVGETYLLVYVEKDYAFGGVRMDGTLVDSVHNKIAARGTAVQGAKCGFKAVQYASDLYPGDGLWQIVLLDTRNMNGVVGGLVASLGTTDGATKSASAESTSLVSLSATTASGETTNLVAVIGSQAAEGTPEPVITSVERGEGTVAQVRFANFANGTVYTVQSRTDLGAGSWENAKGGVGNDNGVKAVEGAGGVRELPVSVSVPSNDTVRFFRVVVGNGASAK